MREFKFRAWDEDGHMFSPTKIEFDKTHKNDTWVWDGEIFGQLGSAVISLMQYTGLKDRNGKDIYEGDIVKTFDKGSIASVEVGEVYMSKYGFWAIKEYGYKDEDLDDDQIEVEISGYTFVGDGTDKRKNCGFEVIGNIYELPEITC